MTALASAVLVPSIENEVPLELANGVVVPVPFHTTCRLAGTTASSLTPDTACFGDGANVRLGNDRKSGGALPKPLVTPSTQSEVPAAAPVRFTVPALLVSTR